MPHQHPSRDNLALQLSAKQKNSTKNKQCAPPEKTWHYNCQQNKKRQQEQTMCPPETTWHCNCQQNKKRQQRTNNANSYATCFLRLMMEASTHSRTMAASSGEVAGSKQRASRYVAVHATYHSTHLGTIKMLLKWGHKWRSNVTCYPENRKMCKCFHLLFCVVVFKTNTQHKYFFLALELSAPSGSHAGLLFINEEQKKLAHYVTCFCHTHWMFTMSQTQKDRGKRQCLQLHHLQTLISNKADQKSNGNCWVCFHSSPIIKGCDVSQLGGPLYCTVCLRRCRNAGTECTQISESLCPEQNFLFKELVKLQASAYSYRILPLATVITVTSWVFLGDQISCIMGFCWWSNQLCPGFLLVIKS